MCMQRGTCTSVTMVTYIPHTQCTYVVTMATWNPMLYVHKRLAISPDSYIFITTESGATCSTETELEISSIIESV